MRIYSKKDLIQYIRGQLGEPLIKVEVTDFQISEMIDSAVQKFTEYCGGKVTEECIARGKRSKNPLTRKRANFASVSRK